MLTCKEVTRLVSESYDRPLPWRKRIGIRLHLLHCRYCTRVARQLRFLHACLRRFAQDYAEKASRARLTAAARARIASALPRP